MTEDGEDAQYVALIGDIRGSRELEDRREAQEKFNRIVDDLNEYIPDNVIASRFTITTGDEFQVLLRAADEAVEAAIFASDRFHPARLRFGIGRGGLETELNPNQAIGMDGPCFHRAREAIKSAREDGGWIRVAGWSDDLNGHVNTMFDLVQCVREDWTDRQTEFALAFKREGSQRGVVDQYNVSKSTVSESLSAGHVQEVHAAEHSLAALLQENVEGNTGP